MAKLSPMMEQYFEIKNKYKYCLLFFRLGDFYEMFYDDALIASKELELTLVKDGVEISETVKYSFETYVKKKLQSSADENFKALLEKTMIYSDSAKDYFANNSK